MKSTPELIQDLIGKMDETLANVSSIDARMQAMEDKKKPDAKDPECEDEEEPNPEEKPSEEPKPVPAEEPEEEEDDEEMEKKVAAMASEIARLKATLSAPGMVASLTAVQAGSDVAAAEGGQTGGAAVKMSAAQALEKYNKIDANDAKARAEFRSVHAAELGLKNRR
jgi:uncharacterized small protein (DUF1192 family)